MHACRRLVSDRVVARDDATTIEVDGRTLPVLPGETIAASMAAAGLAVYGTDPAGAPRGLGCGMGACYACQVDIEGSGHARACMTLAVGGMRLRTARAASGFPLPAGKATTETCDVAVIGAGPAGLSAARLLAEAGLSVTVLDERPSPGGQYFKPLAASHAFRDAPSDRQFRNGSALVEAVRRAGARLTGAATVWDAARDPDGTLRLAVAAEGGTRLVAARTVLIATGAIERPWIVPGWTLPGAMSTGAAQTLARSYRVAPGSRIVICGNGPLNLQVAAELVAGGATVAAVVEAAAPAWQAPHAAFAMLRHRPDLVRDGLVYLAGLRRAGVPVLHRHVLVRVAGGDRAEAAIVARVGPDGRAVPGSETRIEADCVTMGYGFQPADELARLMGCPPGDPRIDDEGRTPVPGVFIAGDCTRPRGAPLAMADGERAAHAILRDLGRSATPGGATGRRRREQAFQDALWQAFAAPLPKPGALADEATIICRCEGVRLADLAPVLPLGSVAAVKRATRCGMGLCQGRYCLPVVAALLDGDATQEALPAIQPPLRPVPAASLTGLAPPAPVAVPARMLHAGGNAGPPSTIACDTLVIGGGVVGLCTARSLALAGEDVVLVEGHRQTGAEASGGNAGSLHVQSLAYAFADFDSPAAALSFGMLPLQRDSVALWQAMAEATDADFEIKVGGGLCLAHDPADLERLRDKVERERRAGIAVELLDAAETRALLPGAGEGVAGASFSPDEGKLNPLLALPAVTRHALAAGVRIVSGSPVDRLERAGNGFRMQAGGTTIHAGRVVLAAGTGTGRLAAMLGAPLAIQATPLQMTVTERVAWPLDMLISHVTQRLTMKQAASGNLIVGGGWRAGADADGRVRVTPAGLGANLRAATDALPALGGVQVLRTWTAVNALPSAGPLIGALPGAPGCFVAVSLNGLTLGPALGEIMADLVRGRAPRWNIAPFDPARPGTFA